MPNKYHKMTHFDRAAHCYDDAARVQSFAGQCLMKELKKMAGSFHGAWLDVGCGRGMLMDEARKIDFAIKGHSFIADGSVMMLRGACHKHPAAMPVASDMEALPFAPASVDVLTYGMALHWARDLTRTLSHGASILKKDGWLALVMPNSDNWKAWRQLLGAHDLSILASSIMPLPRNQEIDEALRHAGCTIFHKETLTFTEHYESPRAFLTALKKQGGRHSVYAGEHLFSSLRQLLCLEDELTLDWSLAMRIARKI